MQLTHHSPPQILLTGMIRCKRRWCVFGFSGMQTLNSWSTGWAALHLHHNHSLTFCQGRCILFCQLAWPVHPRHLLVCPRWQLVCPLPRIVTSPHQSQRQTTTISSTLGSDAGNEGNLEGASDVPHVVVGASPPSKIRKITHIVVGNVHTYFNLHLSWSHIWTKISFLFFFPSYSRMFYDDPLSSPWCMIQNNPPWCRTLQNDIALSITFCTLLYDSIALWLLTIGCMVSSMSIR